MLLLHSVLVRLYNQSRVFELWPQAPVQSLSGFILASKRHSSNRFLIDATVS
jgi:hypothetical protein